MKILQINTVLHTGSIGRIAEELGQSILENGYDSYLAYGRYARESKSKLIRIGSDFDFKCHGMETRLFDNHGLASRKATRTFIEEIKRINPDIIHLHNIHGYYLNYPLLFDYLAEVNIPVVWTLHDCWTLTGHCTHFDSINCQRWKTGCFDCPQKNEYPISFVLDHSKKNWDLKKYYFNKVRNLTIVPVSDWLSSLLKHSYLSDKNSCRIYNGVDLNSFQNADRLRLVEKYKLDKKQILLGVTGVWNNKKGLSDFKQLDERINHNDYQMILVGLTPKQIESLPKSIIGVSRTESVQELAEFYSLADLFLNLTYEDTFPTTNLEALACGTPVLTYNTGGSVEAVTPKTGFIVEQGDLEAVLDAISIVSKNGKAYYSSACRGRAEECYDKNVVYQKYIDLYRQLFNKE